MSTIDNEANSNVFRIESGTQLTEGSQSTASFYHPRDTPKTFFMSPTEVIREQITIKPTKQHVTKVKYESVDSHIRELMVNPRKKGTQQLPKLHIPRGERENNNAYYRQYMLNHKRDSPETLRTHMKNYKSSTRPNSRDLSVLFSHRERIQQDSNAESLRGDKVVTIDESKWENSIRKEGNSAVDAMIKNQNMPLFKVQSLGLVPKQTQRVRLQKQIANIEESSNVKENPIRRSRTIGNPSQDYTNIIEDTSVENHYEFVERPARVSSSPYILEGMRPSHIEKIGIRNPFPFPWNPNPVKSQGEIEENLRKAGFRSSLAMVNKGARLTDEGRVPMEVLMSRDKLPLHQNLSYSNSQSAVTTREEKYRQPRSTVEIKSAGMPNGNIMGKATSSEPRKLQRAVSDVRSYVSPFEDMLSRPETRELNSLNNQPATKLKSKFRGEEAILNKLFNRKK